LITVYACRLASVFETKPIIAEQLEPVEEVVQNERRTIPENWLVELRCLFLEKMSEIVLTCADAALACIELDVIRWESVLGLLSNQRHLRTRAAIIKLMTNFFIRCDQKIRDSFAAKYGFVMLSNELRKYPLEASTVDALFSMTFGEHVTIFNG
jgi:hypothetical protein